MPKDVFTYLVPFDQYAYAYVFDLGDHWSNSGVLVSTLRCCGTCRKGKLPRYIIFGVAAAIALVCLIFRNRIMRVLGTAKHFVNAIKSEKIRANAR